MSLPLSSEEYKLILYIANLADESGYALIDPEKIEKITGIRAEKIVEILKKFEKNKIVEITTFSGDLYETSLEKTIKMIELFLKNKIGEEASVDELILIQRNLGARNALINLIGSIVPKDGENHKGSLKIALNELLRETMARDNYGIMLRIRLQANLDRLANSIYTGIEWIENQVYKNPLLAKIYNDVVLSAIASLEYYTLLLAPLIRRAIIRIEPSKTVFESFILETGIKLNHMYIADRARIEIILHNYENRINILKEIIRKQNIDDENKTLAFKLYNSMLIEKNSIIKYSEIVKEVLKVQ